MRFHFFSQPFFAHIFSVYEESKCQHVWRIGPTPCAFPPTDKKVPYLGGLGDTAVDFDIAPPRVVKNEHADESNANVSLSFYGILQQFSSFSFEFQESKRANQVEWPLVVLRGNGSLYIVLISVGTEK